MKFLSAYKKAMIAPDSALYDALVAISKSGAMMACVVDPSKKLLGIITDSDVRRALLNGASLSDPAKQWMNTRPMTLPVDTPTEEIISISNADGVREIPLISRDRGTLCDIFVSVVHQARQLELDETLTTRPAYPALPNAMLILAGGKGTRLRSVVNDRPKPLALIGNKPILQIIIEQATYFGVRSFYIAVNYLAEQIENHLKDPVFRDLKITIVRENEFLGTAGAIGLLKDQQENDLIVCNGDILNKTPFPTLLKHHSKESADLSCVVRPYTVSVPFGVVSLNNGLVAKIVEKPSFNYLVNSGIYVISPKVLKYIKPNQRMDMTELIQILLDKQMKVYPFVLHEYWLDIGHPEDYQKAIKDYDQHFGADD